MSIQVVYPGDEIRVGPTEVRVICFDWDKRNLPAGITISASTWTITAIKQAGAALTKDSESTLTAAAATIAVITEDDARRGRTITLNDRVSQVRLIGTTATLGDEYLLANKITTTETPYQIKEQNFKVIIQNIAQ